ncbi:MAG: hypothetical protein SNF33_07755 [Candidatus Algichlamydia australiensis]|nr:hypothetical protein [Chlamydiales bacterium]
MSTMAITMPIQVENALKEIDPGSLHATLIHREKYEESDSVGPRDFEDIVLNTTAGKARITISYPKQIPEGGLPCIFVIGGLETGRKSLNLVPDHGSYILISYEYPSVIKKIKKPYGIFYLPRIRRAVLDVAGQVNNSLKWLQTQNFCKNQPPAMIGVSFGSVFLPSIMHLGEQYAMQYGPAVFGYGGAGIKCLFYANLPGPNFWKEGISRFLARIFHPIEPALHLPYINGSFLLVNGTEDKQIPEPCVKKLQELCPDPKKIIELKRGHLQPDNPVLIGELVDISRQWLENQGV